MQTFLPFPDFKLSAQVLDLKRLMKQRVECWQIMKALRHETEGWRNHPATKMWEGYEYYLTLYWYEINEECNARGIRGDLKEVIQGFCDLYVGANNFAPPWLGDSDLHESHQSKLLQKDPDHYAAFFPGVLTNLEYYWPLAKL